MAGKESTTITKTALEDLKKRAAQAATMAKEKTKLTKEAEKSAAAVEILSPEYQKVSTENQKLADEHAKVLEELKALKATQADTPSPTGKHLLNLLLTVV